MRTHVLGTITLMAALVGAAGCATSEDLSARDTHGTHVASGTHAALSVRTALSSEPEITRADVTRARDEGWWGDPVTVSEAAIVAP
jgi:hypothetical protein